MPQRKSASVTTTNKTVGPDIIVDQGEGEIPDLSRDFLSSAFYRRFHIQRPICDPTDFSRRYLAQDPPRASYMGKDGSILVHIMYAWACSYGVDETGNLDVPERNWPGGVLPPETGYVWSHDQVRERDRIGRRAKTDGVVAKILKEIDDAGIMRRHSFDGVRCLLLLLPLTEYVSTPMERLAMYECAVAQVFALCSLSSLGYDGIQHHLGPEGDIIRVRLYWYTFVHEGITSGLKGGRLVLDEDDLENFQASLPQGWALVTRSSAIKSVAKLATAPIRLAVACRLIHKALTGPKARKRERVDKRLMNDAWEALESCWEEFEAIRAEPPGTFLQKDDIIRFADGWRIFMFEAHNVIRESLEHRCAHLVPRPEGAFLTELSLSAEETDPRIQIHREIKHLHDIARAKCEQLTRLIVDIVKMHINTSFFEWDASLVRDGTYYAAMLLAKDHGTEEDVAACLQALNEMRWAYAKTGERSNK
ncbi:hypothetical protein FFLO_04206 [Filobasidium floriforme]|uniref:Transcription factor domain-containing protein n=1 Tax=Filobasidium floriforme TaxID=5210 RepID=A0A8K0JLB5_9TREE|nr:uncharacterized protein HD553DRAFT_265938 [Filobasidium floriforme]KAG7531622.1 hypothetical protein FFLO_04206 [Filobasidium floriforme]KAH8090841.1 hypothetical protein HD553DRAFT_265938 [Filobasidium floriforme]